MKQVHIPEVMKTRCFRSYTLYSYDGARCRADERAFIVQYKAASSLDLERYFSEHAPALQSAHSHRYEGTFRAERCVLSPLSTSDGSFFE